MAGRQGIILIFFVAAGAVFRLLSGNALLQTDLVYSPVKAQDIPGVKSPEGTAKSFYLYIDSGQYSKAYDISLEPIWRQEQNPVSSAAEVDLGSSRFAGYTALGWTSREEFVGRLKKELWPDGSGIKLNNVEAGVSEVIQDGNSLAPYKLQRLEGAYRVKVSGHILGACSIFRWERELTVVKIAGKYKVILDGIKRAGDYSYQSWFSNIKRVKNLRETSCSTSP